MHDMTQMEYGFEDFGSKNNKQVEYESLEHTQVEYKKEDLENENSTQVEYNQEKSWSEEDRLLLLLKKEDREAFRKLYERTARAVYGYALSLLKNPQDAEEVMQDTFLTVWRQADKYRSDGKPMAWIVTIARNLCYMRLRRQTVRMDVSLEEMREQESGWEPGENCQDIELAPEKHLLLEALKTLKEEECSIVLLHDASGMKHREIGELLGIPLPTVLSKYRRAIKKLEKVISGLRT